jgi:hypothetical protein
MRINGRNARKGVFRSADLCLSIKTGSVEFIHLGVQV